MTSGGSPDENGIANHRDGRVDAEAPNPLHVLPPDFFAGLLAVDGPESLTLFIQAHSEIIMGMLPVLESESDPLATEVVNILRLIRDGRNDPAAAWASYRVERASMQRDALQVTRLIERINELVCAERYDAALSVADQAETLARTKGIVQAVPVLLFTKGDIYWTRGTTNRSSNLEHALQSFLDCLTLADKIGNHDLAIESAMRLAAAYGDRTLGEYRDDMPMSENLLREVIRVLPEREPEVLAMCKTNLAVVLLRSTGSDLDDRLEQARVGIVGPVD